MAEQEIAVPAITTAKEYTIFTEIPNVHLWQGTDDPYLYTMDVTIFDEEGKMLDQESQNFGVREFEIKDGKT